MTTQAQLIVQMLDTSSTVIKNYWTDLRHDARLISDAQPGDVFLWAPVESGTRIIVINRGRRPNIRAASIFSAMQQNGKPQQWYRLTIGDANTPPEPDQVLGTSELVPSFDSISYEDACTLVWKATREAEHGDHVSELHM